MAPPKARRRRRWLILLAAFLVLPAGRGFQAALTFHGNLERVGERSISVKLPDRCVVDAMLPDVPALAAAALAAQYKMGDEVEIDCRPITPAWETATSRLQSLEVTAFR